LISFILVTKADQSYSIEVAVNALKTQEKSERPVYHKDIAQLIKAQLDSTKGGTWNVVVGISYGSFVTHETKTMLHFFIGNVAFLIWRHG